jgi:hypothetical protein
MELDSLSNKQLHEICEKLNIRKYKYKNKKELIELIKNNSKDTNMIDEKSIIEKDETIIQEKNREITLINGDCLLEMKNIKDKSIDMILCDLPYGMTKNKWDVVIPFEKLWLEYNRIIKDNGAIVLFGSQPFTSLLITSNLKDFRYCMVWEKNKFSDFKIKLIKLLTYFSYDYPWRLLLFILFHPLFLLL